jgi:hypothetical protein
MPLAWWILALVLVLHVVQFVGLLLLWRLLTALRADVTALEATCRATRHTHSLVIR